jgi:hypothetical protein
VTQVVPSTRIVWQLGARGQMPVRLSLDLRDDSSGVTITHMLQAGWGGAGRLLDPLFRLYFSTALARDLDAHVRAEFPRLREVLVGRDPDGAGVFSGRGAMGVMLVAG